MIGAKTIINPKKSNRMIGAKTINPKKRQLQMRCHNLRVNPPVDPPQSRSSKVLSKNLSPPLYSAAWTQRRGRRSKAALVKSVHEGAALCQH